MRIAALSLVLSLAACASQQTAQYAASTPKPKTAPAARPTPYSYWAPRAAEPWNKTYPSYVPDRIDGSYQGTAYLTSAPNVDQRHYWRHPRIDDAVCPHTLYGVIEIGDHVLYYDYAPNLTFNAPVKDDGTLTQTIGKVILKGKVAHERLTFDIVTPVCTTRFFGSYKLNHS